MKRVLFKMASLVYQEAGAGRELGPVTSVAGWDFSFVSGVPERHI